jgi:HTH-type transcriptional regulator/antitoxin MqsA
MTPATNSSSTEPISCPACGKDTLTLVRKEVAATSRSGAAVRFLDEWSHCEACGEDFFTYEQSLSHSRARTAALRAADSLVSPERIRAARVSLGMTQEEFERALGVGRKTVVRWERGTVPPSKAANGLLWLAERYPSVFLEYASEISPKGGLRTDLTKVIHELVEMAPEILETTGEFAAVSGGNPRLFRFEKHSDSTPPATVEYGGALS